MFNEKTEIKNTFKKRPVQKCYRLKNKKMNLISHIKNTARVKHVSFGKIVVLGGLEPIF